MRHKSLNLK